MNLYPPYCHAPPVPDSPWEEMSLELLASESSIYSAPPAVVVGQGAIRKIPRVPATGFGDYSNRARGSVDRSRQVLNDLMDLGRIAMRSDGKYDLVLDEDLISDALGYVPAEALTVSTGSGINADVSGGVLNIAVDDSVLRVQQIAEGAKVVMWPTSVSDPGSNPSGGVYVWVSSSGEFSARTSSGVITVMASV